MAEYRTVLETEQASLRERQPAGAELVMALLDYQRRLEMPDAKFAALLGVTQPLWSRTRSGDMAVGMAVLTGALRAFPTLRPEVLSFLTRYDPIGARQGRKRAEEDAA